MKRMPLLTLLIALAFLFCLGCSQPPAAVETPVPVEEPAAVDESAPAPTQEPAAAETPAPVEEAAAEASLVLDTLDLDAVANNKLTLVNFWATWCPPCIAEIPDLSALNTKYAEQGFGVIGVLVWDEDIEGAKQYWENTAVSYPMALDAGFLTQQVADNDGIPISIFVDASGAMVSEELIGYRPPDVWETTIQEMLSKVG